jgi:hypothetical protein
MARPDDIHHVQIIFLDQAIQVNIEKVEARRCTPMAQEAWLDMLEFKRLLQQRVVLKVDLSHREVVGGSPIGVHLLQKRRR